MVSYNKCDKWAAEISSDEEKEPVHTPSNNTGTQSGSEKYPIYIHQKDNIDSIELAFLFVPFFL
jgi:hypothetical protein